MNTSFSLAVNKPLDSFSLCHIPKSYVQSVKRAIILIDHTDTNGRTPYTSASYAVPQCSVRPKTDFAKALLTCKH